jgi:ABC-2 type transport system permease protein
LGASPVTGIVGYVLILSGIAFFALAWSGISLSLGLKTKNSETVFGIAGFLTFPLLFMSTALVPVDNLPTWMKYVSSVNPISFTVDGIRALMLNGFDWGKILAATGVIGLIGLLTMGATLFLFRKVVS